jgi:hypothetical protein
VSKQPIFKTAAARLTRIARGDRSAPAPTTTASRPVSGNIPPTCGGQAARTEELIGKSAR